MYDTLEIPLPPSASFSDRIRSFKREVESVSDPLKSEIPYRLNLYYRQVVDLRRVAEIDAILHLNAKKTCTHKIQIIEAGHKCQGQIADTIAEIVNDHPNLLGVSRVDSCADLVDGPSVRWIAQSVRAKSTQWQAQICSIEVSADEAEKYDWSPMGKQQVHTMYWGKRPNCFRCYNKLAERLYVWNVERRRHERMARKIVVDKAMQGAPDVIYTPEAFAVRAVASYHAFKRRKELLCSGRYYLPFPDFKTWFVAQCIGPMTNLVQVQDSSPQLPKVLTRMERQMGAGRVPPQIDTFEKLFSREALDFNPFERLEFSPFDVSTEVCLEDYKPVEFFAGLQIKQCLREGMPYQELWRILDKSRNGKKMVTKFAPFVAAANPSGEAMISLAELYEHYRNSISRQMAA